MKKQLVISLHEAWWVWLGDAPAIRVETECEAKEMLLASGRDYGFPNRDNRPDQASPVAELLWDIPLPDGETFHKTVISPVSMVLHKGVLRKFIYPLPPSRLSSIAKRWYELEPEIQAWWPQQYHAAIDDREVLAVRGKRPVEKQLDEKWPCKP